MESKYKNATSFTYKYPDKENSDCTVFIEYYGETKIDGISGKDNYVLCDTTDTSYIIMNDLFERVELPKGDCRKIPWYI